MSVLNQSGEEQVECPLCMEPLEVDDLNFYPCTCGYQICRFCWHRIRTDENGLCPACRKAYSEDPADFTPLSREQVAKLKADKRHRDQQRKAKLSESRKHLASVRVVQRNLVFVVGLPVRLADPELLKKHEYFGKFGKIHKVVINQSTSYAGSQGPSASAYVTYMKSDDALRAIQSVNNIMIDGRPIKSSLGTTKYCSHFMKNQPCPKADCMYLHDFGDPEASFTKEQMHAGKHQEYEKKLHEALLLRQNTTPPPVQLAGDVKPTTVTTNPKKEPTPPIPNASTNKDNWPQLNTLEKGDKLDKKTESSKDKPKGRTKSSKSTLSSNNININININSIDKKEKLKICDSLCQNSSKFQETSSTLSETKLTEIKKDKDGTTMNLADQVAYLQEHSAVGGGPKLGATLNNDNSSFFSQNFQKIAPEHAAENGYEEEGGEANAEQLQANGHQALLTDVFPAINTTEDWAAAFGFARQNDHLEELAKQGSNVKDTLETFGNGFQTGFGKMDSYSTFYETGKLQENIMDVLATKNNGLGPGEYGISKEPTNGANGLNLEQHMSKFFLDFHKGQNQLAAAGQNGVGGMNDMTTNQQQSHQNGYYQAMRDQIMLLQQRQMDEQLINRPAHKTNYSRHGPPPGVYQNGYVNGESVAAFGHNNPQQHQLYMGGQQQQQQQQPPPPLSQNVRSLAEDELDFDPFQETQKAFAELMATEQNLKSHTQVPGRASLSQANLLNGLVHNQSGAGHLPPPPPGFIQNNTHMNSFGSKILPFLNMSNSQPQLNSSSQNNWPNSNYSNTQQQKNVNTCNDWKNLDPAILSSSRHYPLANMAPLRDHYSTIQQQQQQQQTLKNSSPLRSYSMDYTNNSNSSNTFSNFTQQLQPNFNNFTTHLNPQQNINWFASEFNSQISSPPGFRNSQTKQQEC